MLEDLTTKNTKDTKRVTFVSFVFFVVRTEFPNRIGRNPESKVRGGFLVTVVS
jgi:nucleoid DNA-binding protein